MNDDAMIKALQQSVEQILKAAAEDPELAERALRRLRSDPRLAGLVCLPRTARRTGRRDPAVLDPFKILADDGLSALSARLDALDLEQLRDVVAQFSMDPRRLAMKWKTPERVRDHILQTTELRARKGDAFRTSVDLDERQHELLVAFLVAWDASGMQTPFDLDDRSFTHPHWPEGVRAPRREEVRPLVHSQLLTVDRSAAPTWRLTPTDKARQRLSDDEIA